jgi:hypothetical protein
MDYFCNVKKLTKEDTRPRGEYSTSLVTLSNASSVLFKTGTLTEGDLDLAGVCQSQNGRFSDMVADPTVLGLVTLFVYRLRAVFERVLEPRHGKN